MSNSLETSSRFLLEVELKPRQGSRFQPTGFPDLGAAEIPLNDNTISLLVESPQSMANRLEEVCLNRHKNDFVDELKGLSMIKVNKEGVQITNSVRESHRLGSFYILEGDSKEIQDRLEKELSVGKKVWNTDIDKLAPLIFELDVNSLLHGVWIAKKIADGRIKIPRALSSFIEAKNVKSTVNGGVKIDHVEPSKNEETGGATEGQGNVPFPRIEYTAESITAFFNLDLEQIRNYNLKKEQEDLLINLAFWKIQRFLKKGLRLRTACDLEIKNSKVISPQRFEMPKMSELNRKIKELTTRCKEQLKDPITITYNQKSS